MTFDATIISPERFSTMKVESLTDGRWRSDAIRLVPFVGEWRSCGACSAEGSAKLACASGLSPPPASSGGASSRAAGGRRCVIPAGAPCGAPATGGARGSSDDIGCTESRGPPPSSSSSAAPPQQLTSISDTARLTGNRRSDGTRADPAPLFSLCK